MDRLVVMDRGRVVEQGTHEDLLREDGVYARLWQHQSGGFLDAADRDDSDGSDGSDDTDDTDAPVPASR
jgi:ABC-type glutathione transport system ATPase component